MSSTLWPGTNRSAQVITVMFEAEQAMLAADPTVAGREKTLSTGMYGVNRGVHRLLDVFNQHEVTASWFVPAVNLRRYPELIASIVEAGHELGNCGVDCQNISGLSLVEQLDLVRTAQRTFAEYTNVLPTGFRGARGEAHPDLGRALSQDGFTWSSQLRGEDLPFLEREGLVDLARNYALDDAAYFAFNLDPPIPAGSPRIAPITDVFANWSIELDAHQEEGLCPVLELHPEIIGTPARASMLSELLGIIRSRGDVWIATGRTVTSWWRQQNNATSVPDDHPTTVYTRSSSIAYAGGTP